MKRGSRPGRRIWVIFHCEVWLKPRKHFVDEAVLFVASSKRSVEHIFRTIKVDVGSWWRVECGRLDDLEGHVTGSVLYSRSGKVLKTPPVKEGYRAAVARDKKQLIATRASLEAARKEGRPRTVISNLERAVRDMTWALRGHR